MLPDVFGAPALTIGNPLLMLVIQEATEYSELR
jgi:hypothetical protein